MKYRNKILAALATVAAIALLAWSFAPRPIEVETAAVAMQAFETTLDEDARTRLRDRYTVSAPLAGRLQRIELREGDAVEPGALVAVLNPLPSPLLDSRSLREQQERIGAAEAGVQRANAVVASLRAARDRAQGDLRRTEQLAGQGFVAAGKIETDRLAALVAKKEADAALESLHVAEHELAQARAVLATIRGGAGQAGVALRAPVGGRVLKIHLPSEATVMGGAAIMEIGDITRLEVVAELLSSDALQARPGLPVRIERWGGPAPLQGRVRGVEPAAFTKISALGVEEQRVNVLIDIQSPAAEWAALGDGYRVGVRIVTRSESQVPCVPVSAVFPLPQPPANGTAEVAPDSRAAVFVVDSGRARLVPVTIGARNASVAWVQAGLAPGAEVIVYPPTTLDDGARVARRQR